MVMERSSSTFCQTYIFFAPNIYDVAQTVLTWQAKVVAATTAAAAETNWKHKATPDRGDLMTLKFENYFSDVEARIFWKNMVNAMATDAMAPCITRPSAIMLLNMWDKQVPSNL